MSITHKAAQELLGAVLRGETIKLSGYEFSFGRAALWSPLRILMDLEAIDWSHDEVAFVKTDTLTSHKAVAIMSHLKELEQCSR